MKKYQIELKWAIIFMISALLWMIFEKSMGWHDVLIEKHMSYTNFFAIIATAVYAFALVDKRKNYYHGKITWKQAFITGVIVTLFIIPLNPIAQYLTYFFITPEYFTNIISHSVSTNKMTLTDAENYFSLQNYMLQGLIGGTLMGFATSAIVAFFVKKS
jgi:hypothetical protein